MNILQFGRKDPTWHALEKSRKHLPHRSFETSAEAEWPSGPVDFQGTILNYRKNLLLEIYYTLNMME